MTAAPRATRLSTPAFDWTMTILSAVFVGGLFLDGWAHTHGRVDETFFTPWHAALYSGFLATALFLWGGLVWGVRRGHRWAAALPDGYGLSLLGVALWFVGGPFDFAWHAVFGFEVNVEALMSPAPRCWPSAPRSSPRVRCGRSCAGRPPRGGGTCRWSCP